jgi:hypothetical protein
MRNWTYCIVLAAVAIAPYSIATSDASDKKTNVTRIRAVRDLQQLFTPREVNVEILGTKTPEQFNQIHAKFTQSIKDNGSWFLDYVKSNSQPGQPLPYHENFGVTKNEYEQYHTFLKNIKLVPVAKGRLRFTKRSNDQTVIDGVDGLHEFDGTVIDFKHKHVVTRWGTVPLDKVVHTDEKSSLGSWDGFSGRLQTGDPDSGTVSLVRIDIGRQSKTSLNVVSLSARVLQNGVKTVSVETPVRFP